MSELKIGSEELQERLRKAGLDVAPHSANGEKYIAIYFNCMNLFLESVVDVVSRADPTEREWLKDVFSRSKYQEEDCNRIVYLPDCKY